MSKPEPKQAEIFAAALASIHLGIAMARSRGVVCGSPENVQVTPSEPHQWKGKQ